MSLSSSKCGYIENNVKVRIDRYLCQRLWGMRACQPVAQYLPACLLQTEPSWWSWSADKSDALQEYERWRWTVRLTHTDEKEWSGRVVRETSETFTFYSYACMHLCNTTFHPYLGIGILDLYVHPKARGGRKEGIRLLVPQLSPVFPCWQIKMTQIPSVNAYLSCSSSLQSCCNNKTAIAVQILNEKKLKYWH